MWRHQFLIGLLILLLLAVLARLGHLHIAHKDFLQSQGNARMVRVVEIPSYRGAILDRRGEPLALSTPKDAVAINPKHVHGHAQSIATLSAALKIPFKTLKARIEKNKDRSFLYLKKEVHPDISKYLQDQRIPGVEIERSFRRYYPSGADSAHVVGFTDADDQGQSGIELAFNASLSPIHGKKRVIEDRAGRWINDIEDLEIPQAGSDLTLSIDVRLQNLALRELENALQRTKAKSAALVMIDIPTGEILTMVSAPSFNPNNREERIGDFARNRSVTDLFEPGSTIKPLIVLMGLESGRYTPDTIFHTDPGYYFIRHNRVRDIRNNGDITLTQVLLKSSNVGISRIGLSFEPQEFMDKLARFGFGAPLNLGFPGEMAGRLNDVRRDAFGRATMCFGYGMMATPTHVARAYATIGSYGLFRPLRLTPLTEPLEETRVLDENASKALLEILAKNTEKGSGRRAQIPGYRTASKTGTTRVSVNGHYVDNRHIAFFAGITPVSHPRLATVIMLEEPDEKNDSYYGSVAVAPIYAKVVEAALHLLHVPPDADNTQAAPLPLSAAKKALPSEKKEARIETKTASSDTISPAKNKGVQAEHFYNDENDH